jgi:hypothetical protein
MKNFGSVFSGLIAAVLLTGIAVAQNSVSPVPNCGRAQYQDSTLSIVNPCSITVSVTYTSLGDVSGGTVIGPGQTQRTAYSAQAVAGAGGVHIYTCPGNGTPVEPDGTPIGSHYTGLEYGCHGSASDENGGGNAQNSQIDQVQQPVQKSFAYDVPSSPTPVVIIPVQQADDTQQASDEDDNDENADTSQDSGMDMEQYQQTLRNIMNSMQNQSAPRGAPAPVQGRTSAVCTQYCWK